MELFDSSGSPITSNDNWQDGPDAAAIQAVGLAPEDPHESAIRATLAAGAYTVIVRGVGDDTVVGGMQPGITGIGLVEIYDFNKAATARPIFPPAAPCSPVTGS